MGKPSNGLPRPPQNLRKANVTPTWWREIYNGELTTIERDAYPLLMAFWKNWPTRGLVDCNDNIRYNINNIQDGMSPNHFSNHPMVSIGISRLNYLKSLTGQSANFIMITETDLRHNIILLLAFQMTHDLCLSKFMTSCSLICFDKNTSTFPSLLDNLYFCLSQYMMRNWFFDKVLTLTSCP